MDGFGDILHQQVGEDTGVEITGTYDDDVGSLDGTQRFFTRRRLAVQKNRLIGDRSSPCPFAAGVDLGFATDHLSIFQFSAQRGVGKCHRQHFAGGIQEFLSILQRLEKIALVDFLECGDDQVAEAMAGNSCLLSQILSPEGRLDPAESAPSFLAPPLPLVFSNR